MKANPATPVITTPEGALVPGITDEVDSSAIWAAVERIHESQAMSDCPRLMQFFRFVVASTLRGEAMHLKETTIGVAVFGRPPDYDPKVDTIVRSQAWRLRSKLKKYYDSEGLNEPIIIDLPIGHYVPIFRVRQQLSTGGRLSEHDTEEMAGTDVAERASPGRVPASGKNQ